MKTGTLRFPATPRDQVMRVFDEISTHLPAGRAFTVDVAHDPGCPCERGIQPLAACTCRTVDIAVRADA